MSKRKRKLTVIEQMRSDIHSLLCNQDTGEPTGLNQYFDELVSKTTWVDARLVDYPINTPIWIKNLPESKHRYQYVTTMPAGCDNEFLWMPIP